MPAKTNTFSTLFHLFPFLLLLPLFSFISVLPSFSKNCASFPPLISLLLPPFFSINSCHFVERPSRVTSNLLRTFYHWPFNPPFPFSFEPFPSSEPSPITIRSLISHPRAAKRRKRERNKNILSLLSTSLFPVPVFLPYFPSFFSLCSISLLFSFTSF